MPTELYPPIKLSVTIRLNAEKLKEDAVPTPSSLDQKSTLHGLSLLGGWPGAMIAQQTLRHKSSKESFRAVFWITVVLNCCVFLWMFTSSGSSFLAGLVAW